MTFTGAYIHRERSTLNFLSTTGPSETPADMERGLDHTLDNAGRSE